MDGNRLNLMSKAITLLNDNKELFEIQDKEDIIKTLESIYKDLAKMFEEK